jgi:iron complex outermembrane recepter protein
VRTPKGTATASADYRVPVGTRNLNFVVSYYYNSGFAWDPDNRLRQPSYDVVNTSVDWNARNAWSARLWGRNLTGQHYCVFETATTLLDSCAPASPRTYGITLSAHL